MKPALTRDRVARATVAASQAFEVPAHQITSRRRWPAVVEARQALTCALYQAHRTSYHQIGELLHQHHTTVLHSVREAGRYAAADPDYAERLARIVAACKA